MMVMERDGKPCAIAALPNANTASTARTSFRIARSHDDPPREIRG
jgi:hypothetical protein